MPANDNSYGESWWRDSLRDAGYSTAGVAAGLSAPFTATGMSAALNNLLTLSDRPEVRGLFERAVPQLAANTHINDILNVAKAHKLPVSEVSFGIGGERYAHSGIPGEGVINVNTLSPATAAHELGHARNRKALHFFGPRAGKALENVTTYAKNLAYSSPRNRVIAMSIGPAVAYSRMISGKENSNLDYVLSAAPFAPKLVGEGLASLRAERYGKYFNRAVRNRGGGYTWKPGMGLRGRLGLLAALGTYAAPAIASAGGVFGIQKLNDHKRRGIPAAPPDNPPVTLPAPVSHTVPTTVPQDTNSGRSGGIPAWGYAAGALVHSQ